MTRNEVLLSLSKKYLLAREEYERAVRIAVRGECSMEDKNQFWRIIDDLRNLVVQFRRIDGAVRLACEELVRKTFVETNKDYGPDDLPCFIYTYGRLKGSLDRALAGVYGERRGDNFNNLIDSLPLAGRTACLRLLGGEAQSPTDIDEVVKGESETLSDLIRFSDNYVEQNLENAYSDKLCVMLTRDDAGFALQLENADPPSWEE